MPGLVKGPRAMAVPSTHAPDQDKSHLGKPTVLNRVSDCAPTKALPPLWAVTTQQEHKKGTTDLISNRDLLSTDYVSVGEDIKVNKVGPGEHTYPQSFLPNAVSAISGLHLSMGTQQREQLSSLGWEGDRKPSLSLGFLSCKTGIARPRAVDNEGETTL